MLWNCSQGGWSKSDTSARVSAGGRRGLCCQTFLGNSQNRKLTIRAAARNGTATPISFLRSCLGHLSGVGCGEVQSAEEAGERPASKPSRFVPTRRRRAHAQIEHTQHSSSHPHSHSRREQKFTVESRCTSRCQLLEDGSNHRLRTASSLVWWGVRGCLSALAAVGVRIGCQGCCSGTVWG